MKKSSAIVSFFLIITIVAFAIGCSKRMDTDELQTSYTAMNAPGAEKFNDSICQRAYDSAARFVREGWFAIYRNNNSAFDPAKVSEEVLREKFGLVILGRNKSTLFSFCFNKGMLDAYEKRYHYNPLDSAMQTP